MIGEIPQRLLELFERLLATGERAGGKDRGEDLERVAKLFALDAERMDLVTVAQRTICLVEERRNHRLEMPARESPKARPASPAADIREQSVDSGRPVRVEELFKLLANGRS